MMANERIMMLDFLDKIMLFLMLISIIVSYCVAFKLYKNAPEKESMSFNKYLNAMMMDVSFTKEKNLLVYEDERYKLFRGYRLFILSVICSVFTFAIILFAISN
jgi:hypothetical protein